jgi:hypothetical protein
MQMITLYQGEPLKDNFNEKLIQGFLLLTRTLPYEVDGNHFAVQEFTKELTKRMEKTF